MTWIITFQAIRTVLQIVLSDSWLFSLSRRETLAKFFCSLELTRFYNVIVLYMYCMYVGFSGWYEQNLAGVPI